MGEHPVTYALQGRYARLLGEQIAWGEPQEHITVKLIHLEAVICMFKHDWDRDAVSPIRPIQPSRWGGRGKGVRTAMKVLQPADRPLSVAEISRLTHEAMGYEIPKYQELYTTGWSIVMALQRQLGDRLVVHEGKPRRWEIAQSDGSQLDI